MYKIPFYFDKDKSYKALSFIVGCLSAVMLYSALNSHPPISLLPMNKTMVRFETSISNDNTRLQFTPKDAKKLDKKDEKTPLVQSPSKDPVPTKSPKQKTTSTKKISELKAIETPEEIKSPVIPSEQPGQQDFDQTTHIDQSVPNEVIKTGGVFGSGTPPVETPSKGPMLEIPRVLDKTEIDNNSEMREKVEQAAGMSDKPPLPAEDAVDQSIYTDIPGGDVVILKLFINDSGVVIDAKIMIPSKYPLNDIAVALSSRGAQFKNLVPPLRIGELRELEVRVPYVIDKASPTKNNLP